LGTNREESLQQGGATRTSQANISAALAAADARARAGLDLAVQFPAEQAGHSLADMAQRDLDAALQLLTDRAQYITGSTGAAIALRRNGKNDMLCRASTGANAPELGALLSTEFGLSGESVRTRRALRCDDAERDARVNREVCRQMGIASVMIMPVVHDDEVLGVFELFSGSANAFGERDLSALERLSQMVETAVTVAHAIEQLPERLKNADATDAPALQEFTDADDMILEVEAEAEEVAAEAAADGAANPDSPAERKAELPIDVASNSVIEKPDAPRTQARTEADNGAAAMRPPEVALPNPPAKNKVPAAPSVEETAAASDIPQSSSPPSASAPAKKPLYWSAASANEPQNAAEDQSHFPPVLRNLRKCEACGFPVSPTRALCVDCEEKKWRGQLKSHPPSLRPTVAPPVPVAAQDPTRQVQERNASPAAPLPSTQAVTAPRAFAAAAQSAAIGSPVPAHLGSAAPTGSVQPVSAASSPTESTGESVAPGPSQFGSKTNPALPPEPVNPQTVASPATPEFVLSSGLPPQQSWLAANKYVLGVLLAIIAAAAAFIFLR
jgi:GAF domain-containing protein